MIQLSLFKNIQHNIPQVQEAFQELLKEKNLNTHEWVSLYMYVKP